MELNENCVYHINRFLEPHDWIQVSKVCQLWKEATLKNWETITKIKHANFKGSNDQQATCISGDVAGEIVLRAAPYVKILLTESSIGRKHQYILIGNYCYRVENFKIETTLKLLIRNATGITDLNFRDPPKHSLVRQLFRKNNIKKIALFDDDFTWYQNIQTHGIEDLAIRCNSAKDNFESFEGHFPNLKTLCLQITSTLGEPRRGMLSKILPYVLGLKSLKLMILYKDYSRDSDTLFSDITRLSELEELSLTIRTIKSPELFVKQLPTCCPKLRVVKILIWIKEVEEVTQNIFLLPQLECYECLVKEGFPLIDLPEMKHLTKLRVVVYISNPFYPGFFKAVRMIPSLETLEIEFISAVKVQSFVLLVCGVAKAAAFLGKDVLVAHVDSEVNSTKIRITRSSIQDTAEIFENDRKQLKLSFNFNYEKRIFKDVKEFVQNKLEGYQAFLL